MGCVSSKDSGQNSPTERLTHKGSLDSRVAHVNSSRREDWIQQKKGKLDVGEAKVTLIDKKAARYSGRLYDDDQGEKKGIESHIEKKKVERCEVVDASHPPTEAKKVENFDAHPGVGRVPNSLEAEQIAAGWPSWLASSAAEAIRGWVPRRANTFEKLERIGQGTYSNVYKARDVTHDKLVALKKVRFDSNDPESVKFMSREILILRRLDHPNIIKLKGLITSQTSSSLYLVFEYMEHDLTGLASVPGIRFAEPQIKCYMQQLLNGLDHCHSRGVLHRDIKGSNLLIDDNGILKIADFGLANFFDPQSTVPLTSRVVTLWYRAPELLLGASKYGVAVDLWSAGCILGELYCGRPILPGRTEVEQLHKIFKLCGSPSEDYWRKAKLPHSSVIKPQRPYRRCVAETFKDFPASAVELMENLLSMDPAHRGTAALVLKSQFFTTKPFACNPSSLPKYPPSKEIDAKLRDEEARRQGVSGSKRIAPKESTVVPEPNVIPEPAASVKRRSYSKSSVRGDQSVSGFLFDPSKHYQAVKNGRKDVLENQRREVSRSGPLVFGTAGNKGGKDHDNSYAPSIRSNLSTISGLVATRTSLPEARQEKPCSSQPEVVKHAGRYQGAAFNELDSARKQDQNRQMQKIGDSPQAGGGRPSAKGPNPYHHGAKGNKIYVSGPLLVPSNNVEQMLKEHDRQIQEFARRRLDKTKVGKSNLHRKEETENLMMVSGH
ncbi:hypothetical protein Tsubulata_017606 [Turnera subulata]|uniref:Protein kinase domain-containing protein n=1 Tax=Turnera subulata TaxID=218843 RepID=A0A9Q0F1Z1_9ROSI|nr:hypothetical protein Tsubulata_017606 [Turnera subulata]